MWATKQNQNAQTEPTGRSVSSGLFSFIEISHYFFFDQGSFYLAHFNHVQCENTPNRIQQQNWTRCIHCTCLPSAIGLAASPLVTQRAQFHGSRWCGSRFSECRGPALLLRCTGRNGTDVHSELKKLVPNILITVIKVQRYRDSAVGWSSVPAYARGVRVDDAQAESGSDGSVHTGTLLAENIEAQRSAASHIGHHRTLIKDLRHHQESFLELRYNFETPSSTNTDF